MDDRFPAMTVRPEDPGRASAMAPQYRPAPATPVLQALVALVAEVLDLGVVAIVPAVGGDADGPAEAAGAEPGAGGAAAAAAAACAHFGGPFDPDALAHFVARARLAHDVLIESSPSFPVTAGARPLIGVALRASGGSGDVRAVLVAGDGRQRRLSGLQRRTLGLLGAAAERALAMPVPPAAPEPPGNGRMVLLREAFEALEMPVIAWRSDGTVRFANAAGAQWFGRPGQRLDGLALAGLIGPVAYEASRPAREAVLRGAPQRQELRGGAPGAPGAIVSVDLIPDRDADGTVVGYLALCTPLGPDAVRPAAGPLDALASIGDDLRTPLDAMLGFTQLLRLDPDASLSARQLMSLEHIEASARQLTRLIDDVLALRRMESGSIDLVPIEQPLDPLVAGAMEQSRAAAEAARVDLLFEAGPSSTTVRIDSRRFRQALMTLLALAIQASGPGGRVVVRQGGPVAGRLALVVRASGLPVPAERLASLLGVPSDADGAQRPLRGGAELGLEIARVLLGRMGGALRAHADPSGGMLLELLLPASSDSLPPVAPPPETRPDSPR